MSQSQGKTLVAIPDWPSQLQALKLLYNAEEMVVRYRDDEHDEIGIQSQRDYDYALEFARGNLNHSLVLVLRTPRGQTIAETRVRVDEPLLQLSTHRSGADETPREAKSATASVVVASAPPERQASSTQTHDETDSCQSAQMSLIESQFSMFKRQITEDIENKLSLFMSQLRQSMSSHGPVAAAAAVVGQDVEDGFEFPAVDEMAEAELAAKVAKMLRIRSEAEAVGRRLKLAYFEEELELSGAFNSEFIKDCNVPDGTQLRPHVKFEKQWMLKNTGRLEWNNATFPVKLICVSGNIFVLNDNHVDVKNTEPTEIATVSVNLMTPSKPGSYFSEWRLSCNGYQFGPKIWCSIEVVDDTSAGASKAKSDAAATSLIDLSPVEATATAASNKPSTSGSFNNSLDSFEEVNTSAFHESGEEDHTIEDDILVVPDCFDLNKEWKKRGSHAASSSQSECNIEIFEEGLENRNDLTSTQANTSLNSSFSKDLDSTISVEESANADEEKTVLRPAPVEMRSSEFASKPVAIAIAGAASTNSARSSSSTHSRKSFDEDVIKNVSGTLDLMKNAFKNLSGPSYVGYVCDIDSKQTPTSQQMRADLLRKIAAKDAETPAPVAPKRELTNMEKLIQMGFANRALNDRLLKAHNNDVQKVVQHLIQRSDNNWSH